MIGIGTAAVIVIWYNPQKLGQNVAVQNVLSYSSFFYKTYIIDNSSGNNSELASQIPNSKYIPNSNNLGIAKAQNQGCESAMNDGFDWVMLMDQDSNWNNNEISSYLTEIKSRINGDKMIVSFSPGIINNRKIKSFFGLLRRLIKSKNNFLPSEFEYVDRVLASGNVINLYAWDKIDGFNEDLFIDDVDYDFCYRLIQNKYKILKINKSKMNHTSGGEPRWTILPHGYWYHKERIYYITRNKIFVIKKYPDFARKYKYKLDVIRIFLEKIFLFDFIDLKYVIKGFRDGKNSRLGKYKPSNRLVLCVF